MRVTLRLLAFTGFLILAIHFPSLHFGLYHQGLGVDITQHFIAGVLGALTVLYFVQKSRCQAPKPLIALSMAGGSTILALVWELYEWTRWVVMPETYLYANDNWDSLSDMTYAFLAASATAAVYLARAK